jgi:hypothetical protein
MGVGLSGKGPRPTGNGPEAKWEWARGEVGMGLRRSGNGPEATWEWTTHGDSEHIHGDVQERDFLPAT